MSGSYDGSMIDVSSDSFWEVGNYKRSVKRVDDGNRLCNDLMSCLHERARIEKSYAQQLTEWGKRWRQLIEKGPQYGTLEVAWSALCTEAEKVSELHMEVKSALMGEDYEKLKNWQRDSYHKQMIGGYKETKEADDGFRKAQKPWAKKLKEMETMKKSYHSACKEEKLAASRETNSKLESNNNPEAQKKLQEKLEKCQQEGQKTKERYQKSLEELDKLTPQYMENMEQVFEQWQQFEDTRICFFRELLLEVKQHLDLSTNHRFQTIYQTLEDTVSATDAEDDLKWFRSNHGPGMPMNWPQFEDWSIDLNRTLSRREKKKPSEGVTLTGISSTGSDQHVQPAKTISSLTVPTNTAPVGSNPFDEEDEEDVEEMEEEEEETAVEQQTTVNHISVNKEEIKTLVNRRENTPKQPLLTLFSCFYLCCHGIADRAASLFAPFLCLGYFDPFFLTSLSPPSGGSLLCCSAWSLERWHITPIRVCPSHFLQCRVLQNITCHVHGGAHASGKCLTVRSEYGHTYTHVCTIGL
ncbi:protein kinase C and casein kinase substrate in neurons protein 2 isoform X2 [Anarrhichthys ocellatus]|uniref:protein kinase C and casein kinase substrate in neurons protein 2 isoform X2 n=1 Tax=Anarrhichthys ocellatus TaxID=433405 RepID=UPI0012ED2716|nr:protein kinase C and casein kinase substrate in neurons protein 2 isoform X2 [Anarrhichthys ocellatus]